MHCPRCENVVLDELDRDGITIDRCATCRGIWLDRGELEKLLALAAIESGAPAPGRSYAPERPRYGAEDSEPPSSRRGHHGQRRHRSFWHELFD